MLLAASYDLVIKEFDGCATSVLKGHPVSGKMTALKAVLSVFGQTHFSSGKYLTTIFKNLFSPHSYNLSLIINNSSLV